VLDFDHSLGHKDDLCAVADAGHPGAADQLWIQGRKIGRLAVEAGPGNQTRQCSQLPESS
jgi:hypothetical protein